MQKIKHHNFSVIIPVYNRPDELKYLLESIRRQPVKPFEVIIVEDGSSISSEDVCEPFKADFPLTYLSTPNQGPALARNAGAALAKGEWFLFFDSDCELPNHYFELVTKVLSHDEALHLFGGPDSAAPDFNRFQHAMSYAMTSILTTGGIRGGKKKADIFYPRSFNMGVKREAFEEVSGFRNLRFGEDLDFSMRIIASERKSALIPEAYVFHRRRTNSKAFFRQVFNSGMARWVLEEFHPGTLKVVHTLPSFFTLFLIFCLVIGIANPLAILGVFIPGTVWLLHASLQTKSVFTGVLASWCSYVQLIGYGSGFLWALILKISGTKKLSERYAFRESFYD